LFKLLEKDNAETFNKCLKDRLEHPKDKYCFEFHGLHCCIMSVDRFNWAGRVKWPTDHKHAKFGVSTLNILYKVHGGIRTNDGTNVCFAANTKNDYSLLREMITESPEFLNDHKSFDYVKEQTEKFAKQISKNHSSRRSALDDDAYETLFRGMFDRSRNQTRTPPRTENQQSTSSTEVDDIIDYLESVCSINSKTPRSEPISTDTLINLIKSGRFGVTEIPIPKPTNHSENQKNKEEPSSPPTDKKKDNKKSSSSDDEMPPLLDENGNIVEESPKKSVGKEEAETDNTNETKNFDIKKLDYYDLLALEMIFPGAIKNLSSLKPGDKPCICGQCHKKKDPAEKKNSDEKKNPDEKKDPKDV